MPLVALNNAVGALNNAVGGIESEVKSHLRETCCQGLKTNILGGKTHAARGIHDAQRHRCGASQGQHAVRRWKSAKDGHFSEDFWPSQDFLADFGQSAFPFIIMLMGNGRAGKSTRANQILLHELAADTPFEAENGVEPVTRPPR
jgi:hypothetical protein